MGYRSDVRIITTRDGFKKLKTYTEKYLKEKNWKYGNLMDYFDVNYNDNKCNYFGWNGFKWYDGSPDYEDVNAIVKGLEHLAKNDISYRFTRIGEEFTDIDTYSYDSEKDNEYLDYPYVDRSFDDNYFIKCITNEEDTKNRSEIVNDLYV